MKIHCICVYFHYVIQPCSRFTLLPVYSSPVCCSQMTQEENW